MNEHFVLNSWQLNLHPPPAIPHTSASRKLSPTLWEVPQTGCHKLNFDGASKGNPGPAGYRAVIHNSKGEILHIVAGNLGHNTNNVAEIWGLLYCLQASKEQKLFPIIAEGDSQIVINLLYHLLNGENPEKISPIWRLMNGLLIIKSILQPKWVIFPSHVRRSTNKVADLLAKYGVDLEEGDFSCSPTSSSSHPIVIACRNIANIKDRPPNGVLPGTTRGQFMGRPPGQMTSYLAPDQTYPPDTSPQGLNKVVATLHTTLVANLSHDLEAPQCEKIHGTVQVVSIVTYSSKICCPYNRAWACSSSLAPPRFPSPAFPGSNYPPFLLESSALGLTDLRLAPHPSASPLYFPSQADDSLRRALSER
jgi:ribonuclease HI